PCGHLRKAARLARRLRDKRGGDLIGRMGGEHVVVGGDDVNVRQRVARKSELGVRREYRKGVDHSSERKPRAVWSLAGCLVNPCKIGFAAYARAFANAGGNGFDLSPCSHCSCPLASRRRSSGVNGNQGVAGAAGSLFAAEGAQ